ncbi:conjugal transfer protein [Halobacillus sp. H74]|uniref:conjugal transfer protein n=1 Tax=Halobacillus sp. H74 TaxID=3457436 RepID=UPI003FCD44CC
MGKKKKATLPKKSRGNLIAKIIVYMIIIFCLIGSVRSFTASGSSIPETEPKQEMKNKEDENAAISIGAQTFAQNFVEEYLEWNTEALQKRNEDLEQYLRSGVAEDAGLRYSGLKSHSTPHKTEVINVEETGDNTSIITIHATHYLITKKDDDKKKTEKKGPYSKYLKVPIITDGKGYLVNDIPTFTSKPKKPEIKEEKEEDRTTYKKADRSSIEKYLPTFFKVYSTGTTEELEFYTDDLTLNPLGGDLVFKEVENFNVYDGKGDSLDIKVNVIFTDKKTEGTILQKYNMNILEKDGRWIIQKLN